MRSGQVDKVKAEEGERGRQRGITAQANTREQNTQCCLVKLHRMAAF